MNRIFKIGLIFIILSSFISKNKIDPQTLNDYNLRGKVQFCYEVKKYIIISSEDSLFVIDSTKNNQIQTAELNFNKKGLLLIAKYHHGVDSLTGFYIERIVRTKLGKFKYEIGKDCCIDPHAPTIVKIINNTDNKVTLERINNHLDDTTFIYCSYFNGMINYVNIMNTNFDTITKGVYKYDKSNYLSEMIFYDKKDSLQRRYINKYLEFDNEGNWIKKIESQYYNSILNKNKYEVKLLCTRKLIYY